MGRQQAAHRRKANNRASVLMITAIVLMLTVVVAVKCAELDRKVAEYEAVESQLEEQIAEQQARAEELVEYEKYTQTMKYIEDVAKSKLGLVYEGEIIFRQEN
ncbi:MAG: septum formation initiator family protein [Lachnospiraceae bacterium]|nr:septum formation initiator family protein [Lachnospiraceae bacterium]MBQ8948147.1 septum formation initiator family protein [Lachnospiraceae bacterium]